LLTALSYLVFNILTLILLLKADFIITEQRQFFYIIVDIIAIVLVVHSSGGIQSGLSTLLAISVAAAGIFFIGTIATLVAATATVALILQNIYLSYLDDRFTKDFLGVGFLGILFFTTSLVMQYLAKRIRTSQQIAERKTADALDLQILNNQIVQRMRTGILVVNEYGQIRTMNRAAAKLLEVPEHNSNSTNLAPLNEHLLARLTHWLNSPHVRTKPFQVTNTSPAIQANFAPLQRTADGREDTLIFLEDTSQIAQQAQQLKLASLGRLTASIAHEIRNPLGAISHAAQLLQESDSMDPSDQKLSAIIQKHSRRMNKVIENVLQLSRREAAEPEKIQLKPWLQHFTKELEAFSADTIRVDIDVNPEDIHIPFDPSQLDQVLTNLCQNGLRYSKQASGSATLLLRAFVDSKLGLPCLDVIDDGAGIDEDAQGEIFEPFYTTENTGTGLGLYICRELCEANQTRLDYLKVKGKSCFRLSFSHPEKNITIDSTDT
jgi:two-component system sensor histidine kinase PilS (NtrC family)